MLQPEIERTGLSVRFTANVGENAQFYTMANFYKTDTFAQFTPLGFNGPPTAAEPGGLAAYNVILPVYVCSAGVGTLDGAQHGLQRDQRHAEPVQPVRG